VSSGISVRAIIAPEFRCQGTVVVAAMFKLPEKAIVYHRNPSKAFRMTRRLVLRFRSTPTDEDLKCRNFCNYALGIVRVNTPSLNVDFISDALTGPGRVNAC